MDGYADTQLTFSLIDELQYSLDLVRDTIVSINEIHESGQLTEAETKALHMALVRITESETMLEILNCNRGKDE